MPTISKKRQVTLPLGQCSIAGIQPGDECESFVSRKGVISIVAKRKDAEMGLLKDAPADDKIRE
ncbi:AbrB family transcriptional regulator [Mangrovitalea sediminis]|uniref:AbrB family transcriptional regulator n=1 Tax=Mangrovitalea sediminis TaxID=1982043 RepID=UPI000BE4E2CF|nr:AbrB family transcriptional regulator [Mangrovitalea sediminis]